MRRARIFVGSFLLFIGVLLGSTLTQNTLLHAAGTPTITGISPTSGVVTGGDSVTISGTNFDSTATVRFGSNAATASNWISSTTIVATTPAGYQGVADVSVTNQDGQVATLVNGFTYVEAAPSISSLNPNAGPSAGGQTVIVNGANFTAGLKSVTLTSPDSMSSGGGSTCNIYNGNQIYCWGYNGFGQLGNNSTTSSTPPVTPVMTGALSGKTVRNITSGLGHRCVIASDGKAYCWGRNSFGQLGNNSTTQSNVAVAVDTSGVLAGKTIVQIGAGDQFSCALSSDGQVFCWGLGTSGQLGNSGTTSSSVPVAVTMSGALAGKTVRQLTVGNTHACVIANDNLGYCWGANSDGRIGNNATATSVSAPTAVTMSGPLASATLNSISAGAVHTCAIASDGLGYCWGTNTNGQLGTGNTTAFKIPTTVVSSGALSGKTLLSISSATDHTCAVASDNQAYCWGNNGQGQIGDNGPITVHTSPTAVDTSGVLAGKTVRTIATGYQKACVIASDSQAYCWGNNGSGGLGDGTANTRKVPVAVVPIKGGNPTVTFAGTAATGVSLLSSSQLQVTTPAHALGNVNVAVQNYDTQSATATNAYQYVAGPTASSISPSTGLISGGTNVTIKGTNFYNGMTVTIGGVALTNLVVVDGQTITGTTPSSATPGAQNVVITDPYSQTATLTNGFTYRLPDPTIASITPNQGSYVAGNTVTIKGSNFVDKGSNQTWYRVLFANSNATNVQYVDSSTLTATVPSRGLGRVNVTIQSDYSNDAVLTNGYTYLASSYKFSNTPLTVAANQPGKLTIQALNTSNQPVSSPVDTVIQLSSNSQTGAFAINLNEDESTMWTHSSVVLPAGSTSVDVWYKDSTIGTPIITGAIGSSVSFQQQQTITSKYKFLVSGVSDPVASGVPSSVTVRVVDYDGNPQSDYTGTFSFSSTDTAAQLPPQYTMTAADHGIKTFTNGVVMKTPGEFCVAATDTTSSSITGSQCNISVRSANSGAIDHLSFITSPQSIPVNIPSAPFTIQTQDSSGNPIPVSVDTPLYIYSTSSTASFSVDGSTWSTTKPYQITLPAGSTSVNLYVKDSSATTATISARDLSTDTSDGGADDSGWKNTTQQLVTGVLKADHVSITGPDTLLVNQKGSYTLSLKDANGTTVTALQDNQLTLTASTSTALFYLNGDTVGQAGPVTISIPTGASTVSFQLSDTTASVGSTMTHLSASDTRSTNDANYVQAAQSDIQILTASAGSVTLTPSQGTIEAGQAVPVTLQLLDTNGNNTYASASTTFSLASSSGSGEFSLTNSPFTPITSISLLRGEGMKQLYYKDTLAGTSLIRANNANLTSNASPVEVTSSSTYRFGVTPSSTSAALKAASAAFTATAYDVYGNIVLQPSDLTAYLYSSDSAVVFASQSSGPWTTTSITIPSGQASAQFYAKSDSFITQPATITVSDATPLDTSDTGIVNATSQLNITSQPVSSLAFTSAPQTTTAGQVSAAITVQLKQTDGSPAVQDGTTSLSLSVPEGKLTLTADASATGVTSIPVSIGSASVTFYYSGQQSGVYSILAQMATISTSQSVTVNPDSPAALIFISPPQTIAVAQTSAQMKVNLVDQYGNAASFGSDKTVSLSSSCGDGVFSESTAPWSPTNTLTLPAGNDTFSFYYKGATDGTCTLSASLSGVSTATQSITITPSGPTKLTIHGSASLQTGQVGNYSVDTTDAGGNIVPVSGAFDVNITSNSSSGIISSTVLHFSAGDTTKSFTYKDTSSGTVTLTASDSSNVLSSGAFGVTLSDGVATKLTITPASSTIRAGEKALYTITLLNQYDQPAAASSDTIISLAASEPSGAFYSVANNAQTVTSVLIASGQRSGQVYYGQSKAVQGIITASGSGIAQDQATVTVIPASIASISFVNAAYTGSNALEVGQSGSFQVALLDQYGNQTTSSSPITLYASSNKGTMANGGVFTIPANASTGNFSYSQTQIGTFTLSVSDSSSGTNATLGPITQNGEVVYGAPTTIKFIQNSVTLERGGVSSQLSVQLVNAQGYPTPALSGGQRVNLSMANGTGEFSQTPNGSFTSSLQLTILEGETEAGMYYRNDNAQIEDRSCTTNAQGIRSCITTHTYQHTISAQTSIASNPSATSLPVTMQYGAPVRLAITSPPRTQQTDRPTALITVERQNQYGKAVPLHEDSLINVTTSNPDTGSIGSSKVQWNVQQLKILDSNASTSFYYKDSETGTPTLTVSSVDAALIGDSQQVTVTQGSGPPPPATALLVTNISDPQAQGTPSSVIVIAIDADGFIVESYAGSIHFTSDDPSAVLPSDYTFNPSTDKGSKTFTNQVAFSTPGEKTVTATDTQGLTGAQPDITVLGGNTNPVKSIVFISPSSPMQLEPRKASPLITVRLQDAAGNPTVAPQGGYPIRLTSEHTSGVFSDKDQSTWSQPYQVTIPAGLTFTTLYYKDASVGAYSLTAQDWVNNVDQPSVTNGTLRVINGQPTTTDPQTPEDPSSGIITPPTQPHLSLSDTQNDSANPTNMEDANQPQENTSSPHQTGSNNHEALAEPTKIEPVVVTGSLGVIVLILLGEALRHVLAVHRFRKSIAEHHIAPGVVQSLSLLKEATKSAFTSAFFWIPLIGSIALSIIAGLYANGALAHLTTTQIITGVVTIAIALVSFITVHSLYLSRESNGLKEFFSKRRA